MNTAKDDEGPWCAECDGLVRQGVPGLRVSHRNAAEDTRIAVLTFASPAMRREAGELEAEFGHRWKISVYFGGFFGVRADTPPPHFPVEAGTAEELRGTLRARESVDYWRARDARHREEVLRRERAAQCGNVA